MNIAGLLYIELRYGPFPPLHNMQIYNLNLLSDNYSLSSTNTFHEIKICFEDLKTRLTKEHKNLYMYNVIHYGLSKRCLLISRISEWIMHIKLTKPANYQRLTHDNHKLQSFNIQLFIF